MMDPAMMQAMAAQMGGQKEDDPNKPPSPEVDRKIETALALKEEGTGYFKDGNWKKASFKWKTALRMYLGGMGSLAKKDGDPTMALVGAKMKKDSPNMDQKKRVDEIQLLLNLNLAQVSLKLERWDQVIEFCDDALQLDKDNIKALYRRGKAWYAKKDLDRAKADWTAVEKVDPKAVTADLKRLAKAYDGIAEKEARMAKKMFGGS
eukprot:TRINITY_DN61647_c0_g1_i1.p2 TRINITY_DN61647_c0_g1~~TRINITY_DN61647_c0_g1_i1.p2  ORF type:complete len:225 (-),score=39.53 TRINITY_DN61647_c0_g1_i1:1967-2584(-)